MRLRAVLAVLLLVAAAGCGVRPTDARVVGTGPDTHPAALERARQDAEAASPDLADPSPEEVGAELADDLGRVTVVLRDETGITLVDRAAPIRSDEPIVDAIAALQEPLTASERAAGLWTEVPADTQVRGVWTSRDSLVVDLTGGFARGGTEAGIWRRTQQVACTVLHAMGAPPGTAVEVLLEGERIGRFGVVEWDGVDPCVVSEADDGDAP